MKPKGKFDSATKSEECLICGEGKLTHLIDYNQVEYKGSTGFVALHYSTCDVCGSEQADAEDTRMNKRAMQEFKREVCGT